VQPERRGLIVHDTLLLVMKDIVWSALARRLGGAPAASPPPSAPPPTDETCLEIVGLRRFYKDAQILILRRWTNIRAYEQGAVYLVLFILLILVATFVQSPGAFPDPALFVAVFALVVGAAGALIGSLVTHVVSLEAAVEDLSRQLDLADGASTDAAASAAVAEARRILNGRLRWAMKNREDILTAGGPPKGPWWRRARFAVGMALEAFGAAVLGFYIAVALQGIYEGMLAQVVSVCTIPFIVVWPLMVLGNRIRTSDKRFDATVECFLTPLGP
jgi:hypothetical protein